MAALTPARRLYPERKVTAGGSTFDSLCISPKKASTPPPSVADPNFKSPCSVRRTGDHEHQPSKGEEVASAVPGRRHVAPPSAHLAGAEVVHDPLKSAGRRHSADLVAQKAEERIAQMVNHGHMLARRRYLAGEEHVFGADVFRAEPCPAPKPQSLRCSPFSPTYVDDGTALAMGSFIVPEDCDPSRRPSSCGRRRFSPVDNHLVGATLRDWQAAPEVPRPSRRPGPQGSSLIGGTDRRPILKVQASPSRRPPESLIGGVLLSDMAASWRTP